MRWLYDRIMAMLIDHAPKYEHRPYHQVEQRLDRKPTGGSSSAEPESKEELIAKMEREIVHAAKCNDMATLTAVETSHNAITTEERSRALLTGLMNAMDRSEGR